MTPPLSVIKAFSGVPGFLHVAFDQLLQEIQALDQRLIDVEQQLAELASQSEVCRRLRTIPGIGLIASTAFSGAVGDIGSFRSPRRFASWLGLTPREHSSGNTRHLGAISKRGDGYLRMLLVHGARAVLYSGDAAQRAGRPIDALRAWGMRVRDRCGHNKAAVVIANKLARIVWATWYRQRDFDCRPPHAVAV